MQLHNAAAALLNPEEQGLSENIGAGLGHLLSALFFQMPFFFFLRVCFLPFYFFIFSSWIFPFSLALARKPGCSIPASPGWFWEGGSAFLYVITVLWLSLALEVLMQIKWKTLQQERYSYLHCPIHGPNR